MSQKRKTTIQVNPELNLVLTKYATEQGITKAEAADRVFNILYPKGVDAGAQASLAPSDEDEEGTEEPLKGLELEEGGEISDELQGTVKDLRAIRTIRALTAGLNEKEGGDDKVTAKDLLEIKKIEAAFGPKGGAAAGTDALDASLRRYLGPLRREVRELRGQLQAHTVGDAERERDEYKRRLDERDSKEERQGEMMALLGPQQEMFKELSDRVSALAETLKPESREKPTREEASEETKAIIQLATETRNAVQKLGSGGGGGGAESLTDTIDTLTTLIDKLNEVGTKFRGGGEGDWDWRAATVSTLGEVATEAFKTYRDVHGGVEEGEEESSSSGEKKEKLSQQVILRRVYNYAVKKISEGDLQLNPYEAATALNLSPNRVWWAVEELRKKGMLKAGTTKGTTKEKAEATPGTTKTPEQLEAEGLLEL